MTLFSINNTVLGTTSEQGRMYNERVILHLVRQFPGIPRVQISAKTGLSAQTISVITLSLLERGLILVTGKVKGNRGQPSVMLTLCPEGAYGLGINVDRDHISAALLDFTGKCILLKEIPVQFPTEQEAKSMAMDLVNEVKQVLGERWSKVQGIGLAKPDYMPMWLDSLIFDEKKRSQLPQLQTALQYWQTDDFSSWLTQETQLPCFVENDANAAALNERLFSNNVKTDFFYIFIGTACGGGAITNGECYYGAHGKAADFGLIPTAKGVLGKQILEVLSVASLMRYFEQSSIAYPEGDDAWQDPTVDTVVQSWLIGVADEILPTLLCVAALYDPQSIVFGGRLPPVVLDALVAYLAIFLKKNCPNGMQLPEIQVADTAATSGVVGAAVLPLYSTFAPYKSLLLV